jgi:hypothetical protein
MNGPSGWPQGSTLRRLWEAAGKPEVGDDDLLYRHIEQRLREVDDKVAAAQGKLAACQAHVAAQKALWLGYADLFEEVLLGLQPERLDSMKGPRGVIEVDPPVIDRLRAAAKKCREAAAS